MKRTAVLALTAVLAVAAAACGGGDEDASPETSAPTTTSTTSTTTTAPPPSTIVPVPADVCDQMDDPRITPAATAAEVQRGMYFEYFDTIGNDPIPPEDEHTMTGQLRAVVEEKCPDHLEDFDLGTEWERIVAAAGES